MVDNNDLEHEIYETVTNFYVKYILHKSNTRDQYSKKFNECLESKT
jgi:hypothetical protein